MKRGFWFVLILSLVLVIRCSNDNNNDTGTNPVGNPAIAAITPDKVSLGAEHAEGSLLGTNLSGVTQVSLGDGITVEQVNAVSATEVQIQFSVKNNAAPGVRNISVSTSSGGNFTTAVTLRVINNHAPTAKFTVDPPVGSKNVTFTFDGSASTDPDGDNVGLKWDFGDGTVILGQKVVKHKFGSVGEFSVSLRAKDDQDSTDYATKKMEISENSPPLAKFTVDPPDGNLGTEFYFDASKSYDPDGKIQSYKWDFGDGNKAQGKTAKHTYKKDGNFTVELTVTDNKGQDNSANDKLHVDKSRETVCTTSHGHGPFIRGTVRAVEDGQWAIVDFGPGRNCANTFHKCDDFRKWGAEPPDEFYGIVDKMTDRGNGIMAVHNSCPYKWPPAIGERVYVYFKTCSINHCP